MKFLLTSQKEKHIFVSFVRHNQSDFELAIKACCQCLSVAIITNIACSEIDVNRIYVDHHIGCT